MTVWEMTNGPNSVGDLASLERLLKFSGQEFITNAYLVLIGRRPDPEGAAAYLSQLRGGVSKESILFQLSRSAEGRRFGADVSGIGARYFLSRLAEIPLVGRLLTRYRSGDDQARAPKSPGDAQSASSRGDSVSGTLTAAVVDSTVDRLERAVDCILKFGSGVDAGFMIRHVSNIETLMDIRLRRVSTELSGLRAELRHAISAGRGPAGAAGSVSSLELDEASYLNWAMGQSGYQGQCGYWINHPLSLLHQPGEVSLAQVNERIVELPYALRATKDIPAHGRVLDLGSSESVLALMLASFGFEVTALDVRIYPFTHPNLKFVRDSVLTWRGPEAPLDAIFCISTLEHVGLGYYGDPRTDDDPSEWVMRNMRDWVQAGGLLIFTAPYPPTGASELQRIYDDRCLNRLFQGWKILDRQVFLAPEPCTWLEEQRADPTVANRGVILITAQNEK